MVKMLAKYCQVEKVAKLGCVSIIQIPSVS